MTLLSQVSTSYPRVSRDFFCPDTGVFSYLLSRYGQFTLFPCQPFFIFLKNPAFSISISFFIKTVLFWSFILSTVSIILWIVPKNKCSFLFFICFFASHFPPVEEGEFLLYIMLNFWIPQTWSCLFLLFRFWGWQFIIHCMKQACQKFLIINFIYQQHLFCSLIG